MVTKGDIVGGAVIILIILVFTQAGSFIIKSFTGDQIIQSEDSLFEKVNPLKPSIDPAVLEMKIHELVNGERSRYGRKQLLYDSKLSDIARKHSQDMAANNYFSHDNLRGEEPTDRGAKAGYTCRKVYSSYITSGIAENIFQNNLYSSVTYVNGVPFHEWNDMDKIASSTVSGWMSSPGHRQNILTSTYDREGIGVAVGNDNKVYITQDFC